jgi:FKBP-type peptidyl-prolyl cis-trans isomerase
MKQMLTIAVLAIIVASCNSNYEKTKSGLAYKIFKGDGKRKLKAGDMVKFDGTIKIAGRDTVLFSTNNRLPEYLPFDTTTRETHDFTEVLKYCSVGDSLVVISQVDTLVKRGMAQYNQMFKRGDQIVTSIKILKAITSREEQAKDQQGELDKEKARELAEIEGYLKKNGIKAEKTQNGVYVEQLTAGGPEKVVSGKQVTVNYKGALLQNGKVFDSNTDTAFHHVAPLTMVVGSGQAIRGWDEGLLALSKGSKANLYIPALLGYGPQGMPPAIPAYSSLKFEVQVNNITDAPAKPQIPGMGGVQVDPRQQQDPNDPRFQQQQQQQGRR